MYNLVFQLDSYYDSREAAILRCIEHAKHAAESVRSTDDISEIREKNRNLRIFQQEQDIETINKARSLKAVGERCKQYM